MTDRHTNAGPLVSCLCVTEDRPAFMPWLLWNYDRQGWAKRELVIVDSSAQPLVVDRQDVRVIRAQHRAGVARKRNLALEHARGEIFTWFDDDDWQHPEKLEHLVQALRAGKPFAGSAEGWFLDLQTLRCTRYKAPGRRILFNSAGFRTDAARKVAFPAHVQRASDTRWMATLERRFDTAGEVIDRPLFFWLCHQGNLSNPASKRRFTQDFTALERHIDGAAWGDTGRALEALKDRLGSTVMSERAGWRNQPAVRPRASVAAAAQPAVQAGPEAAVNTPVTAIVKATVQDAAYLGVMVPHMLRQARYPFAERILVVDPRREFAGKYRTRGAVSRQELDRVLDHLKARGEIDRVLEVPYGEDAVATINRAYFGRPGVPTHATTGGPIYPTLWVMEQAATDLVLQFDANIFFYTDGDSWVARALECMRRDPRYWLMMTHAGPPVGPSGRSLAGANLRRARWDGGRGVWRFHTASTRFFLTDRRKLHGRLQVQGSGGGCLPLEQCIGRALTAHGAFRGDIGNCRSWHLHAYSHADPFPDWAPRLVEAIEQGRYPACQAGLYDLSLDRPRDREQWKAILFRANGARQATPAKPATLGPLRQEPPPRALAIDIRNRPTAPLQVIIPVRDRSADRLRATLSALRWQDRAPARTLIVSHGSSADADSGLAALCQEFEVAFERIARPSDPWCKPAALNHGIRQTPADLPYIMALDADMILKPNFLAVVASELEQAAAPGAMVLCRSRDLPRTARIPRDARALRARFERLCHAGRLRGPQGCGGIQAAPRSFFFDAHGYDEAFTWWGEEDRDMVSRAEGYGLHIVWIEDQTAMLHQWHPHATMTSDPARRRLLAQALEDNRALRQAREGLLVRDNPGW